MLFYHCHPFTPFQVIPCFLCWHHLKWNQPECIKSIKATMPVLPLFIVLLLLYSLLLMMHFLHISLGMSVLVICFPCLAGPIRRIKHSLSFLKELYWNVTKVMDDCTCIHGIKEGRGRPFGPLSIIGREMNCLARESNWMDRKVKNMVGKTFFISSPCIQINISCGHSKVRCLLKDCQLPIKSNTKSIKPIFKYATD